MSKLSNMEDTIREFFTGSGSAASTPLGVTVAIDGQKILDLLNTLLAVAPAIEKGLVSIEPFVEAIVAMIRNGGTPTDQQWGDLKSRLDEGSQALADAAAKAQAEIDSKGADVAKGSSK